MSFSHSLKEVVNLIGHQAVIRLVRAKGGRDIGFPQCSHLHDFHWLVMLVGMDNAVTLCKNFEGQKIKLPIEVNVLLHLRNEAIIQDFNNGMKKIKLAAKYQVDRKLIQAILKNSHLVDLDKEAQDNE